MPKGKKSYPTLHYRVNGNIHADHVRVVGNGIDSKVIPLSAAKRLAEHMGLDLIEINSTTDPPIVKVGDYEKMLYDYKKQQKNKPKPKPMKEVRLTTNIAHHDMETKANQARKFIMDGSKVKVTLTMRGRELGRRDESKRSILEFITMMEDVALPESLKDEGNRSIAILKKKK